ncbi:MAG: response regulator [Candidatus Aureabacteria bacterium]|nr:response regulator [Candidatus Auribacterota bacterium]
MNKTVLIIDDSPSLRRLIKYSVNRVYQNLNYLEASNGKEGLDILDSGEKVDVIILDIHMPRMDGITFLKEKSRSSKNKTIPTIVLTKKDDMDLKSEALQYGVVEYLPKPFNVSKMKQVLKKILEEKSP